MINSVGFWTLLKRETMRFLSLPNQTILPSIVSAILNILVFGRFLGSHVQPVGGHPYIVFIFPGLLMMGVVLAAFQNATTSLFISRWEKFIDDLLVAPLSFMSMVVAFVFASVFRGVLTGVVVLIAGLLLLPTPFAHPFLLILTLLLASIVFSASGLIIGLWAERWDDIAIFQNYVVSPLMFLAGVFYSTAMLPVKLQWVNEWNPVYYMVSSARYSILGETEASFGFSIFITGTLALGFFLWAVFLFKRGYKLRT